MAWHRAGNAFANDTVENAVMDLVASGYFQDSSRFAASSRNAAEAAKEINDTYGKLAAIAAKYGARVPVSTVEVN